MINVLLKEAEQSFTRECVASLLVRLTDESKQWFASLRAEEDGDLVSAVILYLSDATISIKEGSFARAGLSCSCAADCLTELGDPSGGRTLYHEAATIYKDSFESAISTSLREALWSLERAYECFSLSGEAVEAQAVRDVYIPLACRVNPFIQQNQLQLPRRSPLLTLTHPMTPAPGGQGDSEL